MDTAPQQHQPTTTTTTMAALAPVHRTTIFEPAALAALKAAGLAPKTISWDDAARNENSCFGPCITDVTLRTKGGACEQMVRPDNFTDKTSDLPADKLRLLHKGKAHTLKEFLDTIQPGLWQPRDEVVLARAQCCFLPLNGRESVDFAVSAYSYNRNSLIVVASAFGTSVYRADGTTQQLLLDIDGESHYYRAAKMVDKQSGKVVRNFAGMSAQQKQENALYIYQVPIETKFRSRGGGGGGYFGGVSSQLESCDALSESEEECGDGFLFDTDMPKSRGRGAVDRGAVARLDVGSRVGRMPELNMEALKRDPRYPITLTIQYYRISDGPVSEAAARDVVAKLNGLEAASVATGSLVVEAPVKAGDAAPPKRATAMDVAKTGTLCDI